MPEEDFKVLSDHYEAFSMVYDGFSARMLGKYSSGFAESVIQSTLDNVKGMVFDTSVFDVSNGTVSVDWQNAEKMFTDALG